MVKPDVYLEPIMWENFLDMMSQTRLQDEYNKAICGCDIFVMLYWTKVGAYTREEFETAFSHFQATKKPFIFTYFKDAPGNGSATSDDTKSLQDFQKKILELGHFQTIFSNIDALKFHFNRQLEKLAENGFLKFERDEDAMPAPGTATYQATGGITVGDNNSGALTTGMQNISSNGGAIIQGAIHVGGNFVGRDSK